MQFAEFNNEQRRQLIDVQQAFSVWHPAAGELAGLGQLKWKSSKGKRYLRLERAGASKSLGRETPALVKQKADHDARRKQLRGRIDSKRKRLDAMAPVNRALALNRLPTIAARISRELDKVGLLGKHVIVAGANALFAYEAASGVVLGSEFVSTQDADLLWDTRQSLLLAATGVQKEGLLGLLRRVDHSFKADFGFNATNRHGYIVDLLCPEPAETTLMRTKGDLEATQMKGALWLLDARKFEQVVIGGDGMPVRMIVPEPRTFALHKLWVSRQDSRQPLKRPRDAGHARMVGALAKTYLRLPFAAKDMPWLPVELRVLLKEFKEK